MLPLSGRESKRRAVGTQSVIAVDRMSDFRFQSPASGMRLVISADTIVGGSALAAHKACRWRSLNLDSEISAVFSK